MIRKDTYPDMYNIENMVPTNSDTAKNTDPKTAKK
jgi:hypothetical protein